MQPLAYIECQGCGARFGVNDGNWVLPRHHVKGWPYLPCPSAGLIGRLICP